MNNIIPITHNISSLGTFLSVWLTHARNNNGESITFEEHGGTYDQPDIRNPRGDLSNQQLVEYAMMAHIPDETISPIFASLHIRDISIVTDNFEKSIRISYDSLDLDNIACLSLGQFQEDILKLKLSQKENSIKLDLRITKKRVQQEMNTYIEVEGNGVLYVSVKELLTEEAATLIEKLSLYTEVPAENFSVSDLNTWRELSNNTISKYTPYIQ